MQEQLKDMRGWRSTTQLVTGQLLTHGALPGNWTGICFFSRVISSPVYTTEGFQEALFSLDTLMLMLLACRIGAPGPWSV